MHYNQAELEDDSLPDSTVLELTHSCRAVVTSQLARSMDSAKRLSSHQITLSSDLFNEAELPIVSWDSIKLSPKIWAVWLRILWLLGYSPNAESFDQAKVRAEIAACRLITLAEKHQTVLFVGHGIFNRILAKALIQKGWKGNTKTKSSYWSVNVFEHS